MSVSLISALIKKSYLKFKMMHHRLHVSHFEAFKNKKTGHQKSRLIQFDVIFPPTQHKNAKFQAPKINTGSGS